MEEKELVWLASEAANHERIAEIGCWMGRSTRALTDHTVGTVWAVDTWNGSDEEGHRKALENKPPDWLYERFLGNMQDRIADLKLMPVRMDSVKAASVLRNMQFDMVFIDGSHDFDSVMADITAWQPLIRQGGIICGHDRGYPPVAQAVATLLGEVSGETDIWVKQL
jgi:predicted O-methyltransferase YrrM